jgi:hypothetical protein
MGNDAPERYDLFQLLTDLDVNMINTTRFAFVATALALASSGSFALTSDLGTLNESGTYFGNTFNQAVVSFTDNYTFKVAAAGDISGALVDYKASVFFRDVNISKLELVGGGLNILLSANVPDVYTFQFAGLAQDVLYTLKVTGSVSSSVFGSVDKASYDGFIATSPSVASGAPEASDALMAAMGLIGVGFWARARKAAAK